MPKLAVEDAVIATATPADAEAILTLQRLAFQQEAALYDDYTMPPLTQTLEQLRDEFTTHIILKAAVDERIVGSVRGRVDGNTCHIARLMVHPDYQGRGIGRRLMAAIEAQANVDRFELFTGDRSTANIRLYQSLGYREIYRKTKTPKITVICMEKVQNASLV